MTFKKVVSAFLAICLVATFLVATSGCEDLGAYEDTEEYYNSLGDNNKNLFLIDVDGTHKFSVEDYFYNKESREDFLTDQDGVYTGVPHSEYVYMAIPLRNDINMDTLALYIQSQNDVAVYINVFVTDKIPSNWKPIVDNDTNQEESGNQTPEVTYDDPDPETRVGETTVHLKNGKWSSFVLDYFQVNGTAQKSIEIKEGQYILLQFRNNSGVRVFDEEKQIYVDPQTGTELQKVEITMTNLLIRALDIKKVNEVQGGE